MKTNILIIILFTFFNYHSQSQVVLPIDSASGKIMFKEKIIMDSVSKDELFNRASIWFATNYNSSKDVIQRSDKVDGVIIGKALFLHYQLGMMGENIDSGNRITYTISVFTKDGKYMYEITDFIFHGTYVTVEVNKAVSPRDGYSKKYWIRAQQGCLDEANTIIRSLKKAMNTTKSDW